MLLQIPTELIKEAIKVNNDNAIGILFACLLTFISILLAAVVYLQVSLIKSKDKHATDIIKVMDDYSHAVNVQAASNERLTSGIDANTIAVHNVVKVLDRAIEYKLRV